MSTNLTTDHMPHLAAVAVREDCSTNDPTSRVSAIGRRTQRRPRVPPLERHSVCPRLVIPVRGGS